VAAARQSATPMIAQYRALKAEHPECLLFFRLGDFYELFFEDALKAAPALDIALTRRGRQGDDDIPMCGVPVHSAESYLERLIRKGFKVAICEQTEDPAKARQRGAKAIVERAVVRVVTLGTLTEDSLLEARRHNFLAALAQSQQALALAWLDVSTGAFLTGPASEQGLAAELARIDPGELLLPERLLEAPALRPLWRDWQDRLTPLPDREFESLNGERRLKAGFEVAALDGFGSFSRAELGACGALIGYLELTQKGRQPHLAPPRRVVPGSNMQIDAATRRNLELLSSLAGERRGSLIGAIDRTVTGAGGRLLAARLAAPLAQPEPIRRRLDAVQALVDQPPLREALQAPLKGCPDMERSLSRLSLGRGGPRDLLALRLALARAATIRATLAESGSPLAPSAEGIAALEDLSTRLEAALADDPPLLARDGGFIRAGWHEELDQQRGLRDQARRHVMALERRMQGETGINSLKIRHNNMLGYYIEVTATHRAKVPEHFVQRQGMAGATRYSTKELAELESEIAGAAERALILELELFDGLCRGVLAEADAIARTAQALARLDVAAGLAELAGEMRYCRPEIDESDAFRIVGGRHPVVEQALESEGQRFIANDADLSEQHRLWLLTGPNMAGKSTFLRQNALIAILAQAGSFVPAERAHLGVVDRLFSRVGAADDLARGRSTFMVEMVETAAILHQATERSLVILDEIGRGTATYDGLSIAWAVVEHLHEVNRCRGLFATHYHELTVLAARLPQLVCRTMRVKEWQGDVVFLHEVAEGAADRSYGVHVARLAGLPDAVLARAEEVLHGLEQGEARSAPARLAEDLPLFAAVIERAKPKPARREVSAIESALATVDPDALTARDALQLVYRLKALLNDRTEAAGP
jgi:DNA mismatch repair protein MutS